MELSGIKKGRRLGKGAYASVFEVKGRSEVLKCNHHQGLASAATLREMDALVVLHGHPHIVELVEIRNEGFLLARAESSLYRYVREQKCSEEKRLKFLLQALQGLEYAHLHGITHCDVKSENILIQGNTAKVADFGLAQYLCPGSSRDKETVSPSYRAPELYLGEDYDSRIDVWAWACMAYDVLTEEFLFQYPSKLTPPRLREQIKQGLTKLDSLANKDFATLLRRCLSENRPTSTEVLNDSFWNFTRGQIDELRSRFVPSPPVSVTTLPLETNEIFKKVTKGARKRVVAHARDLLTSWQGSGDLERKIQLCLHVAERLLYGLSPDRYEHKPTGDIRGWKEMEQDLLRSCQYNLYTITDFEKKALDM